MAKAWQYAKLRSSRDGKSPNPSESEQVNKMEELISRSIYARPENMRRDTFRKDPELHAVEEVELSETFQLTEPFGEWVVKQNGGTNAPANSCQNGQGGREREDTRRHAFR